MTRKIDTVSSPWGEFIRSSTTLTDGEVLMSDTYELDGDPAVLLRAADPAVAAGMLPSLEAFFADPDGWRRRAVNATVSEFSDEPPSDEEIEEAMDDLVLQTVVVEADGSIVLHLDDSCGEHVMEGYWPAVSFDADGDVSQVFVES
ncbi:MAG: hypothetical protein Q4G35_08370 [Propionibacteriaceae bacterium]|nr:hypothetical protein [Propionibacteriaceae bacterium]